MKKIVLVAAIAAIAACAEPATETEVVEEAAEEVAAMTAADGGTPYGEYTVTDSEGNVSNEVLLEDGTFTSTSADGEVSVGTWEQKSPELFCVTMDEEGAEQECYNEAVGEDGVWTSTDPSDDTVSTVVRVEG